ncbi:MAG: oligosaccharide flippase family protein, partial [Elusimicrobiota bacterium]
MSFKSIAGKVSLMFAATVTNALLLNLGLLLIGRSIGPEEFGRYFLVFALANFVVLPTAYGLGPALTFTLARQQAHGSLPMVTVAFAAAALMSLAVLWVLQATLARAASMPVELVRYGICFSAPLAGYLFLESVLKGLREFKMLALLRIAVPALFIVTALLLLRWLPGSFAVALWGRVVPYIVALACFLPALLRLWTPLHWDGLVPFLSYAGTAAVSSSASVFFTTADKLLLAGILPAASIGVYAGHFIASFMVSGRLSEILMSVLFPEATRSNAQPGARADTTGMMRQSFL